VNANPDSGHHKKQILQDHQDIEALMLQVATGASRAETIEAIERLRPLLERHFQSEEAELSGLHAEIVQKAPRHANALQMLKDEHAAILVQVDELAAIAKSSEAPDARRQELGEKLKARLEEHEATETEIFVDSIWTDLGAGD